MSLKVLLPIRTRKDYGGWSRENALGFTCWAICNADIANEMTTGHLAFSKIIDNGWKIVVRGEECTIDALDKCAKESDWYLL